MSIEAQAAFESTLVNHREEIDHLRGITEQLVRAHCALRRDHACLHGQYHTLLDCLDLGSVLPRPCAVLQFRRRQQANLLFTVFLEAETVLSYAGMTASGYLCMASRSCKESLDGASSEVALRCSLGLLRATRTGSSLGFGGSQEWRNKIFQGIAHTIMPAGMGGKSSGEVSSSFQAASGFMPTLSHRGDLNVHEDSCPETSQARAAHPQFFDLCDGDDEDDCSACTQCGGILTNPGDDMGSLEECHEKSLQGPDMSMDRVWSSFEGPPSLQGDRAADQAKAQESLTHAVTAPGFSEAGQQALPFPAGEASGPQPPNLGARRSAEDPAAPRGTPRNTAASQSMAQDLSVCAAAATGAPKVGLRAPAFQTGGTSSLWTPDLASRISAKGHMALQGMPGSTAAGQAKVQMPQKVAEVPSRPIEVDLLAPTFLPGGTSGPQLPRPGAQSSAEDPTSQQGRPGRTVADQAKEREPLMHAAIPAEAPEAGMQSPASLSGGASGPRPPELGSQSSAEDTAVPRELPVHSAIVTGVPEASPQAPVLQSGGASGPRSPDLNPRNLAGDPTDPQGASGNMASSQAKAQELPMREVALVGALEACLQAPASPSGVADGPRLPGPDGRHLAQGPTAPSGVLGNTEAGPAGAQMLPPPAAAATGVPATDPLASAPQSVGASGLQPLDLSARSQATALQSWGASGPRLPGLSAQSCPEDPAASRGAPGRAAASQAEAWESPVHATAAVGMPGARLQAPALLASEASSPQLLGLGAQSGVTVASKAEAPHEGLFEVWEVVNSRPLVRKDRTLESKEIGRLQEGALLKQLSLQAKRLNYKLLHGNGPEEGWITIQTQGKKLVRPACWPRLPSADALAGLPVEQPHSSSAALLPASGETSGRHEQHKILIANHAEAEVSETPEGTRGGAASRMQERAPLASPESASVAVEAGGPQLASVRPRAPERRPERGPAATPGPTAANTAVGTATGAAAAAGSAAEAAPAAGGPRALIGVREEAARQGHDAAVVSVPAVPAGWSCPDNPQKIWTYWDQGADAMPWFNKLCVETWKQHLPEWEIVIVGKETLPKWLPGGKGLPSTFHSIELPQHRADCVKSALLLQYGGIYMDSSIIVWKNLEKIVGWEDIITGRSTLTAFFNGKITYVENYFLASRRNSPLMAKWHRMHTKYWESRRCCKNFIKDPFFKGVDLARSIRPEDSSYLVQHACYVKLYHSDLEGFRGLAREAKLIDTEGPTGALWVFNRLYKHAMLRLQCGPAPLRAWTPGAAAPSALQGRGSREPPRKASWQKAALSHRRLPMNWNQALLGVLKGPARPFIDSVERNQVPLAKFTGHVNLSRESLDLLRGDSLIGNMLRLGLECTAKASQQVSQPPMWPHQVPGSLTCEHR